MGRIGLVDRSALTIRLGTRAKSAGERGHPQTSSDCSSELARRAKSRLLYPTRLHQIHLAERIPIFPKRQCSRYRFRPSQLPYVCLECCYLCSTRRYDCIDVRQVMGKHSDRIARRSFLKAVMAAAGTVSVGRGLAAEKAHEKQPDSGGINLREKFFGCIAGCHIGSAMGAASRAGPTRGSNASTDCSTGPCRTRTTARRTGCASPAPPRTASSGRS